MAKWHRSVREQERGRERERKRGGRVKKSAKERNIEEEERCK